MKRVNGSDPLLAAFLKAIGDLESREIERHAETLKRLDQTRELFLRGRDEAKRLEERVKSLEGWRKAIEEART